VHVGKNGLGNLVDGGVRGRYDQISGKGAEKTSVFPGCDFSVIVEVVKGCADAVGEQARVVEDIASVWSLSAEDHPQQLLSAGGLRGRNQVYFYVVVVWYRVSTGNGVGSSFGLAIHGSAVQLVAAGAVRVVFRFRTAKCNEQEPSHQQRGRK
jgi:hypothetical protein